MLKLDLGCGQRPKKGFLHADINRGSKHLDVLCSVYALPFKPDSFDYIYCDNVLEHLINPFRAVKEISKAGKTVILKVPNKEYYYWKTSDSANEHVFSWTEYTLRNFLRKCFKHVKIKGSNRQIKHVNVKYGLFLAVVRALFSRFNELTAICKN